jgi:hypothetical protein
MRVLVWAVLFASIAWNPVLADDAVNLVGMWSGQRNRIAKEEGRRSGPATLLITEQQGRTFTGHLKRFNPTGDEDETLWGAFTPGAKLMMGADDEGTHLFNLLDQNILDCCNDELARQLGWYAHG